MRIAITGARGFTGRLFTERAAAAGHEVVPIQSDITDGSAIQAEIQRLEMDAVVHLAAISFVGHDDDRAFYDVNLFGTLNLLEALTRSRRALRCVLLASSANVYGNTDRSPIAESQPPSPVNHYAMSKLAMEHMARAGFSELPLVIARPFNYTGPGQGPQFVIPKLVAHFRQRTTRVSLGNLHVQREYNDGRFVCDAYLDLLERGSAGSTYNVCTGVAYDLKTVIGVLQNLTGHSVEVDVDSALVRPNEVHRLCGDPSRLLDAIGYTSAYQLEDTLKWMLGERQ